MRKKKTLLKQTRQKSFVKNVPALTPKEQAKFPNRLFYGDNLEVLRKYIKDNSVDLCYIDPPFNSKRNYNQIYNNVGQEDKAQAQAFVDTWTWDTTADVGLADILDNKNGVFSKQSINLIIGLDKVLGKGSLFSYLIHMTQRIAEIYRVLKPTGCFYLHCDPSASHYLKLITDSLFCSRNGEFLNEIIWKRTAAHSSSKKYGPVHDIIMFYSKSNLFTWNKLYQPYDPEYLDTFFDQVDEKGRRYQRIDLTGAGTTNGESGRSWRGINVSSKGRHWAYTHAQMEEWDKQRKLHWPKKAGGMPRLKVYPEEKKGVVLQDIWTDIKPLHNLAAERLGYPTQKPEALLERIIRASTNEGDIILDAYCGCGTSVAVAERLGRSWIGIDITYHSISLILKRLEEHFGVSTIKNIVLSGVPEDFKSAEALAHKKDDKTRKEFEKWAVLAYSNNRAVINEKKGADNGIDGIAYLLDFNVKKEKDYKQIIFSVKSSKALTPSVIRDLFGTIERENAAMGVLITLYPMDSLVKESKKYGLYNNSILGQSYSKIQVVTIEEILSGKTMKIPTSIKIVKDAVNHGKTVQQELDF